MTIDINLLRTDKGGEPEKVRESELKRCRDGTVVDKVIAADDEWRKVIFELEQVKKDLNAVNKQIGERKKANKADKCEDLMAKSAEMKQKLPLAEQVTEEKEAAREALLKSIGNIVHPSVVPSADEEQNELVRTWGTVDESVKFDGTPGKLHHHEIMERLSGYDMKKGTEIAGHRGYFLKGPGVVLNMALQQYGLSFLIKRGYEPIYPPFFMKREVMSQTAELSDFAEMLYRIPMEKEAKEAKEGEKNGKGAAKAKEKEDKERDDLFLIATSEQPISALHRGEYIEERTLPYRYAGVSTCFRKEAGSHGKDMWGIFRIHQFEKIEQFVICNPDESWNMHDEMIHTAEEFYQSLELPYRVVSIVGGALNDAAAKKYDLEAWFPGYGAFRELVSCSNCTDFQSRALNIRLGTPKGGEQVKKFVHMLNATLVATQRAMCCILENYQTPEGVRVPRVLVPYMNGMEFIPYPKIEGKQ